MADWKSSYLKTAEYDDKSRHLTVQFHDGSRWRYHNVSPETWKAFDAARSKGSFFRQVIRGRHRTEMLP